MDGNRVLFDKSEYMLFEAMGDSQAEQPAADVAITTQTNTSFNSDNDDDAESCSASLQQAPADEREIELSDVVEDERKDNFSYVNNEDGVAVAEVVDDESQGNYGYINNEAEAEVEVDEDGVVDQYRVRVVLAGKQQLKKSTKDQDRDKDKDKQKEKDRLFWEACLAS